jgi:hypothetical protein
MVRVLAATAVLLAALVCTTGESWLEHPPAFSPPKPLELVRTPVGQPCVLCNVVFSQVPVTFSSQSVLDLKGV